MKKVFIGLAFAICLSAHGQDTKTDFNWSKPNYSFVKAYLYGLNEDTFGPIILRGQLNPTVVDTAGVVLNPKQISSVLGVVNGNSLGQEIVLNECFLPHHGIVFYDQKGKPVADISICFYCERILLFPKGKEPETGLDILSKIIQELGFPVYDHPSLYYEYGKSLTSKKK